MSTDRDFRYPSPLAVRLLKTIAWLISKPAWFVRFTGKHHIPTSPQGFVVAANHQTYVDPVWVTLPIKRRLRFMAFQTAFEWERIGPLISYLGAFPVALDGKRSKGAIRTALRALKDGAALVIFPEGAREFADGKLFDFKEGAMHIAIAAGVAVLPVTIRGGNRVWPQGKKYPRLFRRVEIIYHEPYFPQSEDAEGETENLKRIIESAL